MTKKYKNTFVSCDEEYLTAEQIVDSLRWGIRWSDVPDEAKPEVLEKLEERRLEGIEEAKNAKQYTQFKNTFSSQKEEFLDVRDILEGMRLGTINHEKLPSEALEEIKEHMGFLHERGLDMDVIVECLNNGVWTMSMLPDDIKTRLKEYKVSLESAPKAS